ncbi:hypothetical protein [Legionella israelensis]|uniref:Uncharacterized protein n=1 Tax=Legionella israelensis TaxID=454 RepID=A0A0W0VVJ2_9GAMM|nr:hypothetical protein [Legionella israelensis]KTD23702.1 hypothetical protein Lisr_1383 [Legionella israelensis]QBS10917.1 hypothetical protein E4T55_14350 [Legionella israelensis]SCX79957.1 hypothetical protein SAMN02746069_00245 [Legionella israelensis DSM 19235]STX57906.1 Uncharacterised protein [Legionella israelensis]
MKAKFENFFFSRRKPSSCIKMPKINTGAISIEHGGCFGGVGVKVTKPHLTVNDEKIAQDMAEKNTYTFKV